MEPIPFHIPDLDETDIAGVTGVLRSGWLTTGQRCRQFEADFAEFLQGTEGLHAIAVNSGTSAMHLALEACGVGPGDRVLVPVMTFTATAEVVRYLGADPVFVDISGVDANLTVETVEAALSGLEDPHTVRALMPVHYGGRACNMPALCSLAEARGWRVIDDAAHALPSTSGGRLVGTWGDATAFSFYATKTLCTGEGGMVVTSDQELADRMRVMRLHGISRDAFDRYRSGSTDWAYEIVAPGFKYNLTDLAASLGITQLARLESTTAARELRARRYTEGFASHPDLCPPPGPEQGDRHAWHLYSLRIEGPRERRDRIIELLSEAGISTSVHFIPLHRMPYWRERYQLENTQFPMAEKVFAGQISLPLYPSLGLDQVDRVVEAVLAAVERTR